MQILKSTVARLNQLGQQPWLDFVDRKLMHSGHLQRLIEEDGLCGITSNPTIFEKAISSSKDYDTDIRKYVRQGLTAKNIVIRLMVADIQEACDHFRGLYEQTEGTAGFVSIEVDPRLARETEMTIDEAHLLWDWVDRPNVFVKIPGTVEGITAIRQCLADGLNINITLLFSLPRYNKIANTYIEALEDRQGRHQSIGHIASVASFFLSRIDSKIDPLLEHKTLFNDAGETEADLASSLLGTIGIASAKMAYQMYREIFETSRWEHLEHAGARRQKLLWASTGPKNPAFPDLKYIEPLIGPDTVNTMPLETLEAYRDHGGPEVRLEQNIRQANHHLARLSDLGINLEEITDELEEEGIRKFVEPYEKLLELMNKRGASR